MRDVFRQAGQRAWGHILSPATLAELSPPDRWQPGTGAESFVAERGGEVIGFVCVRRSADEDATPTCGEIDAFYVHPSMWGRGAGRALLAAGIAHLAAAGFTEATLWSEYRNHRPLQFYRAAGWHLDGCERQRSYRGTELVELRHRVTLGPVREGSTSSKRP